MLKRFIRKQIRKMIIDETIFPVIWEECRSLYSEDNVYTTHSYLDEMFRKQSRFLQKG